MDAAPADATQAPARKLPTMGAADVSRRGGLTGYDIPEPSIGRQAVEMGASWLPPVDVPMAVRGAKRAIGGDAGGGAGMVAMSMAGLVPLGKIAAKGTEAVRKAAPLLAAEMGARGVVGMAPDRLAKLSPAQFGRLRKSVPGDFAAPDDFASAYEARARLLEEAQRRSSRDADMRAADMLDPHVFRESQMPNADMVRGLGPNRTGRRR